MCTLADENCMMNSWDDAFRHSKGVERQKKTGFFNHNFQMEKHNFVTIADLSKEKIMYLIDMASEFEKHPNRELLKGKVVATLFYEPSTRTRLSFETAANRLGARVIGFSDAKASSVSKGETLKDTILMVSNYADVIAMRHSLEGAAQYASEVAPVPIINAGDGAHQQPSKTHASLPCAAMNSTTSAFHSPCSRPCAAFKASTSSNCIDTASTSKKADAAARSSHRWPTR